MKSHRLTSEHLLLALALLIGGCLRLINLGLAPLSDFEANWALQALNVARGGDVTIGSQTGYIMLSGFLFWLFGSSNCLARLIPALAGCALILSPVLFRPRLKRIPILILAFGLALDPGLVSISRLAGGPMLAVACVGLAAGFAYQRQPILAGIFSGMALLSGPALWLGLLSIAVTLLILRWRKQLPPTEDSNFAALEPTGFGWQSFLRQGILALVITLVLVASLCFRYPQGLSAWLLSIPEFFKGWATPSGIPVLRLLAGLLIYQPLAVIFALVCIVHLLFFSTHAHLDQPLIKCFTLWIVITLLIDFSYTGRNMSELVWTLIPLWTLAALEMGTLVDPGESIWIALGEAILIFILLCVTWLLVAAIASAPGINLDSLHIAQLAGSLLLLIFAAYLFSLGWGWQVSRAGLTWGSMAFLGLYMLSASWGSAQYSAGGKQLTRQELWYPAPLTGEADLFLSTLGDLSVWHTNDRHSIDVRLAVDAPSMLWVMRDYPNVEYASTQTPVADISHLPPEQLPPIIITFPLDSELNLSAAYRGQDFAWQIYPAWGGILPDPFLAWLVFRDAPQEAVQVTLWARADLFPGGSLEPEETDQSTP